MNKQAAQLFSEGLRNFAAGSGKSQAVFTKAMEQLAKSLSDKQEEFRKKKAQLESDIANGSRLTKHRISL